MTVYVRWYGKVLEGELLDGEVMGMKQVKIPLDGHRPIALFTPGHVYDSPEQVTEKSSIKHTNSDELCAKTHENYAEQPKIDINDIMPADDRRMIEAFKQENWDHERGHLRIDKLDEFYQLWRMAMTPFCYVEAVHNSCTPQRPAAISEGYSEITKPYSETSGTYRQTSSPSSQASKKPSRKMLRSTGQQQFNDATQLSIFD